MDLTSLLKTPRKLSVVIRPTHYIPRSTRSRSNQSSKQQLSSCSGLSLYDHTVSLSSKPQILDALATLRLRPVRKPTKAASFLRRRSSHFCSEDFAQAALQATTIPSHYRASAKPRQRRRKVERLVSAPVQTDNLD